jgi:ankyrin repeat protein
MSRRPPLPVLLALPALLFGASVASADEIHDLLKDGQVEKARALLVKNKKLIEAREEELQQTPLHIAAHRGQVGMVKFLLERGAKVNARAYNQFTPLRLAEDPEVVKLLIGYGADLEARDAWDRTALEEAASLCAGGESSVDDEPRRKKVKLLLDAGAYYDIRSAAYLGDVDRVRVLLKKDPTLARSKGLLSIAARYGHPAIVKLLLEHKADPQETGWNGQPVLYSAIEYPEVVRLLLEAGADPKGPPEDEGVPFGPLDPERRTPLHDAAAHGPVETAKLLLGAGVPVDVRTASNRTPLHFAAEHGRPEMVRFLLKNKAGVQGEDGRRALTAAASRIRPAEEKDEREKTARYKEIIAILLDQGVPLDFFTAIALGNTARVKEMLKEQPALARSKDGDNKSALFRAVILGHKEIVALLLDAGAPVNDKYALGCTVLHWAAFWGRAEIAKLLIEHKADVHARAVDDFTPLHESARLGTTAVARVLLAAGADVNARDDKGRTPLSWAERPEMIRLLREHGATK